MKKILRSLSILFFAVFALTNCQTKNSEAEAQLTIDDDLDAILHKSSNNIGLSYYTLPDPDDYHLIPQDPRNLLNADKVELGKLLFHEAGIALKPELGESLLFYSCASCHHAQAGFQAGMVQGVGEGGLGFGLRGDGRFISPNYSDTDLDVQPIRSPSVLNTAYQKNMLWNGQFGATGVNTGTESVWTPNSPKQINQLGFEGLEVQAIAGLDVHRMLISGSVVSTHPTYVELFRKAFPEVAEENLINAVQAGLALAAYERTLLSNEAPFQKWLRGNKDALTESQKKGAMLFFDKAQCYQCHNGPALSSMTFHALGLKDLYQNPKAKNAAVNSIENRGRGGFTNQDADDYKFKVPQLYNLKDSPFYGHGASFTSIEEVIRYKNKAIKENTLVPDTQLSPHFAPLGLSDEEVLQLTDFIENALYDPNLSRYLPASVPSGNCFPNNDPDSKRDLNCN